MFQDKQCINDMNDAHAYEMQVQKWKLNTWGVTSTVGWNNSEASWE
jgi:hypothetical protein